jgi:hypothetical protein
MATDRNNRNSCPNDISSARIPWYKKLGPRSVRRVEIPGGSDVENQGCIRRRTFVPNRNLETEHKSLWRRVADTSIAFFKPGVVGSRGEQRSESSLEADATSRHSSAYSIEVIARGVRGLQIGERNLQINTYEYEVERPNIDFAAVLGRAGVREALKALSADPDNTELQCTADRALAGGPLFRREPELRVEQGPITIERQSTFFETFIFVQKCEGVQIGNDATQKNRFAYLVAPTWDARQLLADDANVRAALISCLCATDTARSEQIFRHELADALEHMTLTSPGVRTAGDAIRPGRHSRVYVEGRDGAQVDIGGRGEQENKASAVIEIPGSIVRSLREERDILEKHRKQDERECSRREEPNIAEGLGEIDSSKVDWTSSPPKKVSSRFDNDKFIGGAEGGPQYGPDEQGGSTSGIISFGLGAGLQNGDRSSDPNTPDDVPYEQGNRAHGFTVMPLHFGLGTGTQNGDRSSDPDEPDDRERDDYADRFDR